MFRRFVVVSAVFIAMCVALSSSAVMAQSKDEGMRIFNEADALRQKAQSNADLQQAVQKYQQALTIFERVAFKEGIGWTTNNLGLVFSNWGQYDKAVEYYEKSLTIARELKDRKAEGQSLNNLGIVFYHWGQYDKAVDYYEKSLAMRRELKDRRGEGPALGNLATVYWQWGQYAKAVEFYEKQLAIARELKDQKGESNAIMGLGNVFSHWGQYDKAVEYYEKSLAVARELKNRQGEVNPLNNLGIVYKNWGQYDKAVEYYEKSLAICRELKDRKGEGQSLNNLGIVYKNWGQYDKAVDYYEKSLAIFRELKNRKEEGATLNNLGLVYNDWGQYDKAVEYYEKSLAIKREIKDRQGEGQSLMSMGRVLQHRGEDKNALDQFQKGLVIYTEIKVPTKLPKSLIADTYMDTGDLAKAEPLLKEVNYSTSWGRYYLLKADYKKAQDMYAHLLKSAEQNRNADNLFTAYTGLGKAHEALEDYKSAEEYYQKGMNLTEEIRTSLLPSERKNFFEVKINGFPRSEPAQGLTRIRMKLNQASESIDSSERTRARAFSDNISLRSGTSRSGIPNDILEREDVLVTKVAVMKKELAKTDKSKQPGRYEVLEKQVRDAESDLKAFVEMLWDKYKPYASVKYPRPVTLKESALKPEECVVVFDVSGEGTGVKLIKGKEIVETYYKKWKLEDLEKDVRKFRQAFEEAKLKDFDSELGQSLYNGLLARILLEVPKGAPLVIIPDGILAVLPFEALVVSGKATWKGDNSKPYPEGLTYLGDLYPISYYQSITALTLARTIGSKGKAGEKTLVIADPVFEPDDVRLKNAAGDLKLKKLAALPETLMYIKKQAGLTFPRLSRTAELGASLKKLQPGKTDLFMGMQATKNILFDKPLTDYGSIIFATHGYFGKDIPGIQEPVLAMTLVSQPKDRDGFLRMTEVMAMKLNANVVALTACQTGIGKNLSGEGVMSMGRAFQYAGAKSILMSLWSVSESASVKLVESFFRNLKAGKSKLESLKLARDEIRKSGYDHPFYWAPFILVGEVN